jgi:hypothetical protein
VDGAVDAGGDPMILLASIAAVVAFAALICVLMELGNEEAIKAGYLRENEDPEQYSSFDLESLP